MSNGRRAARRLAQVQTPVIPLMGELIRSTPGTLSLGQGMAHWGPPPQALEAAQRALLDDRELNAYGPVAGEPALRAALAGWLREQHHLDLDHSAADAKPR